MASGVFRRGPVEIDAADNPPAIPFPGLFVQEERQVEVPHR
jgi:hypothetical protein